MQLLANAPTDRKKVTLLIVEDDRFMLDGIKDLLQVVDMGYDVTVLTADNGKKGLTIVTETPIDLIVSDIMMPQMDGYQFLEHVRQNPQWANIPVIFLTAKGEEKDIIKAKYIGANLFLTKPFTSSDLQAFIKTQLDRKFQKEIFWHKNIESFKKDVLQILNHEFRTPLTYVNAYYQMLAESDDISPDYLRGIQVGCIRLTKLIEDFIQVIELRTGEAQANYGQKAQVIENLPKLIQESIHLSQKRCEPQRVTINYVNTAPLPAIWGDWNSLITALSRIIDNAIKFTYTQTKGQGTVQITTQKTQKEIAILIQDEGIGFPKNVQNKIFDLFYQYNRHIMEQQGAGTGLTIAKELVSLHGGRIDVQSELGKGSIFTVVLPVYDLSQSEGEPPQITLPLHATVLLVEDDLHLLEGLRELLELGTEKYDLEIFTAMNGRQGLEVMAEHQPHLIISDIMMPYMDGYEFFEQVRLNPNFVHIPFVFLTAKSDSQDIRFAQMKGVEEYIPKPYESDVLVRLVNSHLDRYFQQQNTQSQSFEALKQNILDLITPEFIDPLKMVDQYSQELVSNLKSDLQTKQDLKDALTGIQEGSSHLTHLVENFIALAEIKTGEAALAFEMKALPIPNVGLLVYEAGQLAQQTLQETGIELEIHSDIDTQLPPILGETLMLSDCLQQLIVLIATYYQPISPQIVTLSSQSDAHSIQLSFQFSGSLPEDLWANLQTLLSEKGDSAIGEIEHGPSLRIVYGYIGLHNGRFQLARSETSFTITIDLPIYNQTPTHS